MDRTDATEQLGQCIAQARLVEHIVGAHPPVEALAVDQLHAEKPAVVAEQLVQLTEVGVAHVGQRPKLALDSIDAVRIEPA